MREASRRDRDSRGAWAGAGGRVGPAGAVLPGRGARSSLASRPLLPQQLSRPEGSGGTVGPRGLRACRERSLGFRGCLEGRWGKARRINALEFRRGHDPRTAPGAERVPGLHLHLEQAQRPAGTAGSERGKRRAQGGWADPSQCLGRSLGAAGRAAGRGRVPARGPGGPCSRGPRGAGGRGVRGLGPGRGTRDGPQWPSLGEPALGNGERGPSRPQVEI